MHAPAAEADFAASSVERRRHPRYGVLESGLLYGDDGCVDCQVIDVSASGARLRPVGPTPSSSRRCRLLLARLGLVEAEVSWAGGDAVGVRFNATPDAVTERFGRLFVRAVS